MKKVSLFGAFFLMAIMVFTSCLGDGNNERTGPAIGIVTTHEKTFQKVLDVGGMYFRSPTFETVSEGACYWILYHLDEDSEANKNAYQTGIYTVTVLEKVEFERNQVFPSLTDTSEVLNKELALLNPVYQWFGYFKGRAFFVHALNQPKEQQNYWNLSYDSQNMTTEENGSRIYELFLRATVKSETTNSSEDQAKYCAYYMKDFFETAAKAEKEQGKSEISFRINYVSEIKDENITWKKTELMKYSINYILVDEEEK